MHTSRYNRYLECNTSEGTTYLIYNSISNGLGTVNQPLYNALQQNDKEYLRNCVEFESLKMGGFVYETQPDELGKLEYTFESLRRQKSVLNLTILPTFNCNFRCSYCFEDMTAKHGNLELSETTREQILDFIQKSATQPGLQKIIINWTGGEPLLAYKKILSMMETSNAIAAAQNLQIEHYMVSNGYLLTANRAKQLSDRGMKRIQITIDGDRTTHNQRRVLEGQRGTFDKIMKNIKSSSEYIHITIRTNVDRHNVNSLTSYLDELSQFAYKDRFSVYFSATTSYTAGGCQSNGSCFVNEEFADVLLDLYALAIQKGLHISYYPMYTPVACAAISENSLVIQPDGGLQKCWNTVGNPRYLVGHIGNKETESMQADPWLSYSPYKIEKCRSCDVLPLCGGGCAQQSFENSEREPVCREFKYNFEEMLRFNYELQLQTNHQV
ncbi:hypothetical protein B9G55_12275 [Saccharibacillus sp. O16]|nr:hypothetical protein B9G55_12275 [Saccharibacillus sp. O16]